MLPILMAGALAGALLLVSGATDAKSVKVTGTIYNCEELLGGLCQDQATRGVAIEFRKLGILAHTFSASSQADGTYVIDLPSGQYEVSLPTCKGYQNQATNIRRLGPPNFLRENWTVASSGSCSSFTPLDQSP